MRIGGLQKFSLIDYPDRIAAVIFTQGCNFRCPYCHNAELVLPECYGKLVPENEVLGFLERRCRDLEGVVITGGEPTIQYDLASFLRRVKALGYAVKLDTNGNRPDVLDRLFRAHLIDYVAMDIKAPIGKYSHAAGRSVNVTRIKESIALVLQSGIPHQFRTTLVKPLCTAEDLPQIADLIPASAPYAVQNFRPGPKVIGADGMTLEGYGEKSFAQIRQEWSRGVYAEI